MKISGGLRWKQVTIYINKSSQVCSEWTTKLPEKQQQNKAILIISSISDIALINRLYLKWKENTSEVLSQRRINVSLIFFLISHEICLYNKWNLVLKQLHIDITGLVYEVCDQTTGWPFRKEREDLDAYFGLKTGQGFLEFKCKSKVHRQQWVDGIQNMLDKVGCIEDVEHSLQSLNLK